MAEKGTRAVRPSVEEAIGAQLRAWREAAGLTQDDVARAGREEGLAWTRNTVTALEQGRRDLSLLEYLTIRGGEFGWADVAPLFGGPRRHAGSGVRIGGTRYASASAGVDPRVSEWLDSEQRAAQKLGITTAALLAAARKQWGHSVTEERDRRVDIQTAGAQPAARTLQAHRGHVTRALIAELQHTVNSSTRKRR